MTGSEVILIILLVELVVFSVVTLALVTVELTAKVSAESPMVKVSIGTVAVPIKPATILKAPWFSVIVPVPLALVLIMLLLQTTVPPLMLSVPTAVPEAAL